MKTSEMIRHLQHSLEEHGDIEVVVYTTRQAPASRTDPGFVVTPGSRSSYGYMLPDYVYRGVPQGEPVLFLGDLTELDLEHNRAIHEHREPRSAFEMFQERISVKGKEVSDADQ